MTKVHQNWQHAISVFPESFQPLTGHGNLRTRLATPRKVATIQHKAVSFKSALLIPTGSREAFYSNNLALFYVSCNREPHLQRCSTILYCSFLGKNVCFQCFQVLKLLATSIYFSGYKLCRASKTLQSANSKNQIKSFQFLLSNDPGKVDSNFFCYAATVLSPHRNVLIFTQRMHKPT